jgi:hypothetical protein
MQLVRGKNSMRGDWRVSLVLVLSVFIANVGCPISSQRPGKAAKRIHVVVSGGGSSSTNPFPAKPSDLPKPQDPSPHQPGKSPIVGFVFHLQVSLPASSVGRPHQVGTFAPCPILTVHVPVRDLSPDTPPPKRFAS